MATAKEFDLEKYIRKICKKANVHPGTNILEGQKNIPKTFSLQLGALLGIVINQNWDPAFHPRNAKIIMDSNKFSEVLMDYKTEEGLVPEEILVLYVKSAQKFFPYGLYITNVFEALSLYNEIEDVSDSSNPVFISGETGTGKEVLANIIHNNSPRGNKQFIPINCAGMPDELLYAELFGYVKGAFTGAIRDYNGYAAEANGGTLFLDEVGDMGPKSQTALLRFLDDKKYRRLGDIKEFKSDCRIICASNE